jgi:YegS/Rv2252/BmrU family lipid kinase
MAETTIVVNPIAGRGAGEKLAPRVERALRGLGLSFEMVCTREPGHAVALARDAAWQGRRTVVAMGGDGTVNEVLNGILQAQPPGETDALQRGSGCAGTALAVLPIGTGNDFAFGAGLSLDLEEACQALVRGQERLIDVGQVRADTDRADTDGALYFGNGVGLGFDAMVNIESRKLKRLRGFMVYLVAVFRTLAFYYHAPGIRVQVDDRQMILPSIMVSVTNGCRFGGGFYVTPDSRMDDGLLDLCVAGEMSRPEMVGFVPRFMRGTHVNDPRVTMTRGKKVTVISESPWAAHVDGEIYGLGGQRFEMEVTPHCLRLIT